MENLKDKKDLLNVDENNSFQMNKENIKLTNEYASSKIITNLVIDDPVRKRVSNSYVIKPAIKPRNSLNLDDSIVNYSNTSHNSSNVLNNSILKSSTNYNINNIDIFNSNTTTVNDNNDKNNIINEISKWKCYKCDQIFRPGELAIIAEHVDPNARWHKNCFRCNKCDQKLNDLLYFNKDNKIYCEYDFKVLMTSRTCSACKMVSL